MNGSVSGAEALATSARTKAQFEWLRLAAERLGYFSTARSSLAMVLRDFCSSVYPRAKSAPLHPHEAEFARNAFEYSQNIDRHFERVDNLYEFVDLSRALDTPKLGFDVSPEQMRRYRLGTTGLVIELRNCTEFVEPLFRTVSGWDIRLDEEDEASPAAVRIWKNDGRYYWDMPYPGPHGRFEEPLTDPVDLLQQIHNQVETLYSIENPSHFFLRSAAIDIGDKLVLLVGGRKTGKTTLSIALAARGHRLLGDDRIAIDSETERCVAVGTVPRVSFPFPSDESFWPAEKLAKKHLGPHNKSMGFVDLPEKLFAPRGLSKPTSALVVLERSDHPIEAALLPIKKAEMLKAIIPLHFGNTRSARAAFNALFTSVDDAGSFTLRYTNAERAADVIEQEFSSGRSASG